MKTPRWHPIRFTPNEPQCGEILVRFEVSYSYDSVFNPEKSQDVKLY
jgi:hypothetical protein